MPAFFLKVFSKKLLRVGPSFCSYPNTPQMTNANADETERLFFENWDEYFERESEGRVGSSQGGFQPSRETG